MFLLVGGTQVNATVIDMLLAPYEGVVAAETGHVACHEAGAIEFGGHKVLTIPGYEGKMHAEDLEDYIRVFYENESYEHTVFPGAVYVSLSTEYGTLYSKAELAAIHAVCQKREIPLFVDGARPAYALAADECDITPARAGAAVRRVLHRRHQVRRALRRGCGVLRHARPGAPHSAY